jgi:hypothetical protein
MSALWRTESADWTTIIVRYSPLVSVRLGQTIALTLEAQLGMSSIGVW